jgi:uncharacterized phage protein (TIGR02218 family)
MKTVSAAMQLHLQQATTTLATCWKITRTDGEVFGFTDHDQPLTISGLEYKASSGYFRSAIANSSEASVDNLEVEGFLDDDSIAEVELRNGAFDYATVNIFIVNWADLGDGIIRMRYGIFGETTILSSGLFRIELRGLTQLFTQTVGDVYQPECRVDLGDTKCGIVTEPPVRASSTRYEEGDRVLVPELESGLSSEARHYNNDFSVVQHDAGWDKSGGAIGEATNEDEDTGEPSGGWEYRLRSRAGILTRFISDEFVEDVLADEGIIEAPLTIRIRMSITLDVDYIDEEFTLRIENFFNTLSSEQTLTGAAISGSPGGVGEFEVSMTYVPGETYRMKFTTSNPMGNVAPITSRLATLESYDASVTFLVTADKVVDYKYNEFSPWDGTFEGYGWLESGASYDIYFVVETTWLTPIRGDYMGRLTTETFLNGSYFQPRDYVDLTTLPDLDTAALDAGDYELEIGIWLAAQSYGMSIEIQATFFDAGLVSLGSETSASLTYSDLRDWSRVSHQFTIPTGTRFVRVYYRTYREDLVGDNNLYFDAPFFTIYEPTFLSNEDYQRYGNVEFTAMDSGYTAASQPAFDFTPGLTTVDGGVTWECTNPVYMVTAPITSVDDYYNFYASSLNGYVTGYFDWGIVEFLDGPNRGRRIEVDLFVSGTGKITTKLPFPYLPETGQIIRIVAGCDKNRTTCHSKFDNIINFRGEPDVPGTDQYFKVAGT